ncbi:hypothetical protein RND71_026123 [Anisodus tanguticus]|uniref:NET2A-D/KIP1-like alpha-helical domain-containing protein n=1 Tax=Anisodus tanguticus TaxID=243964 RepID=A0AAE1RMP8_9SOLA|nr:hypothetical protein RND71_026123 [Anisodus tanguticus]
MASLTVTQLAEKIDELMCEIVSLETAVSAQTVLIDRLRSEADDLQSQIQILEDDKEPLAEENKQNLNITRTSLDCLAEKLSSVKPDEEIQDEEEVAVKVKSQEEPKKNRKFIKVQVEVPRT